MTAGASSSAAAKSPRKSPRAVKIKMSKGQKSYMTRSIKQINALLWRNPEEVPCTLDKLEKADSDQGTDDRMWPRTMSKMASVPKPWLAAKLQRYQPLLTTAKLELMDTTPKDDTIRKTAQFCTGIDFSGWKMPRGALVKKILSMVMDARYDAYGRRLTERFVEQVTETGQVDWSAAGIHGMVAIGADVPKEVCNAVTKLGEKDPRMLPGGIHVMQNEKIIQNWSDVFASLSSFSLVFSEHTCCWKDHGLVRCSHFLCSTQSARPSTRNMACSRHRQLVVSVSVRLRIACQKAPAPHPPQCQPTSPSLPSASPRAAGFPKPASRRQLLFNHL